MVFCLPGDDGESKGAHDDPLAIEHLQERLHEGKEGDGGVDDVDEEEDEDGKDEQEKENLDEEPDVVLLLLHLWAAAVGWAWAEARHRCSRALFGTSTHRDSS